MCCDRCGPDIGAWPCPLSRALDCAIALAEGLETIKNEDDKYSFSEANKALAAGLAAWEGER